jgi:hypothetical protein
LSNQFKRAIILGAGASCSYDASPTGVRPPLAKEIISTFSKLSLAENRLVLIGHLVNYVRDTRGIPPAFFSRWDEDIECFFSEIDDEIEKISKQISDGAKLDTATFLSNQLTVGAYNQLIFLFAAILNDIQNGPVSLPYSLLASELNQNDAVITFNWDTLFDRALWSTGNWSPKTGYFLTPESIFDDDWISANDYSESINSPLYLKLHGSTNWLAPYHQPGLHFSTKQRFTLSSYGMDKLYVFLRATAPYHTHESRYWGPYEPFSYCYYPPNLPLKRDDVPIGHTPVRILFAPDLPEHANSSIGEQTVYSMPLIVPPIRNKQYLRYGKVFSSLWNKSKDVLSNVEEIYIIGYSFPTTDHVTKAMFFDSVTSNQNLKKIVIWNPFPEDIYRMLKDEMNIDSKIIEVWKRRFETPKDFDGSMLRQY